SGAISVLGRRYGQSDWRELRKQIGLVSSSLRQMIPTDEPALETVVSGKFAMIGLWGEPNVSDRRRALMLLRQVDCKQVRQCRWRSEERRVGKECRSGGGPGQSTRKTYMMRECKRAVAMKAAGRNP